MYNVHFICNLFSLLVNKNLKKKRHNDNDCHLKISFAVAFVPLMTIINYRALTLAWKTGKQISTLVYKKRGQTKENI